MDTVLITEGSEQRAYVSFVQAGAAFETVASARAVEIGSTTALIAPEVKTTLVLNRVIGLGLAEPASESMLDDIDALYRPHGGAYGIEVSSSARPTELKDWLRARRIRKSTSTLLVYRRCDIVASDYKGLRVVLASSGAEREVVGEICAQVFRVPEAARTLIIGADAAAGWRHWLAYSGATPIAAALSFVSGRVAWLGWDATLPEHRGRGAHLALIARRLIDAYEGDCDYATAETAAGTSSAPDASLRNYERLGFSKSHERATYVAMPRPAKPT